MTLHLRALLPGLLLTAAFTVAAADNVITPTRGTIDAISGNQMEITTRQGKNSASK